MWGIIAKILLTKYSNKSKVNINSVTLDVAKTRFMLQLFLDLSVGYKEYISPSIISVLLEHCAIYAAYCRHMPAKLH
jgi:hypothetical protein